MRFKVVLPLKILHKLLDGATEGDGEGPKENKKEKSRRLKKQRDADRDAQLEAGADDAFITTNKKQESAKIGLSAMHEENNSREATLNALNQKLQALASQVNQLLMTISAVAATNPAIVDILTQQCANLNEMIQQTNDEISQHADGKVEVPDAVSKYVDLTCRKLPTGNSVCSPIKATPKATTKKLRGKNVLKAAVDVGEEFADGDAHVDAVKRAYEEGELYQHLDRELDRRTTEGEMATLNTRLFGKDTPTSFDKGTQFIPEASTVVSRTSPLPENSTAAEHTEEDSIMTQAIPLPTQANSPVSLSSPAKKKKEKIPQEKVRFHCKPQRTRTET